MIQAIIPSFLPQDPPTSPNHRGFLRHPHRHLPNHHTLRNLNNFKLTLHLGRVQSSKTLVGILFLLVLVHPLGPVHLNIWILLGKFCQSWPKCGILILFLEDNQEMETSFSPFGGLIVNLPVKLEVQGILFLSTLSRESQLVRWEIDLLVDEVH